MAQLGRQWQHLTRLKPSHHRSGDGPGLSKAHFRWGQALLLSRAHSGDGKPFALVPALDLLNHAGSAAGASVRFDRDAATFELVATRAHAPGAQTKDVRTLRS